MNRKPIFEAIKTLLGRGFHAHEVAQIDTAIDGALGLIQPPTVVSTSAAGIELIHSFEGYAAKLSDGSCKAYPDPATGAAPWTIGWGTTTDEQGKPIAPGTVWTRERADARFKQHLRQFEESVIRALGESVHQIAQHQFDALVSLAYNIGPANLAKSTLIKRHREGAYGAAADQFGVWNRAAGKVMAGLTRRRAAEAEMYRGLS